MLAIIDTAPHAASDANRIAQVADRIIVPVSGPASTSGMLRRLWAWPRRNGLAVALREIGRIERTLFTLDWIRDPVLRRRSSAGLNKEARNAFARADMTMGAGLALGSLQRDAAGD